MTQSLACGFTIYLNLIKVNDFIDPSRFYRFYPHKNLFHPITAPILTEKHRYIPQKTLLSPTQSIH